MGRGLEARHRVLPRHQIGATMVATCVAMCACCVDQNGELAMPSDRRLTAAAQIAADVVIVVLAAYLTSVPTAFLFAIVLGFFFYRWWRRTDVDKLP
jgi:hypothetical protein